MRLALVGAGRWGARYIATIAQMKDVELAYLATSKPENRALVSPDCVVVPCWRDVLKAGSVDGVIIATPPQVHAEIAVAALAAGIPVLVEKPLTLDVDEAEAIAAAAKKSQLPVVVDHIHLYNEAYRKLKETLPTLGKLRHIECDAGNDGPRRKDVLPLWDWGVHDLAMCLDLAGGMPCSQTAARNAYDVSPAGIAEDSEIWLSFSSGVSAHVRLSNMRKEKKRSMAVYCEHGALVFDDLKQQDKLRIIKNGATVSTIPLRVAMPLQTVVEVFCEAVRTSPPGQPDLDLGVNCVRLLAALQAIIERQ